MRTNETSTMRTFQTPSVTEVPTPAKKHKTVFRPGATRLPWYVAAVFVLISIFLFIQYRQAKAKLTVGSSSYTSSLLTSLSSIINVPAGTPTIATVKDISKISSVPFYAHAQNGDVLFVYGSAHEAILYRPSSHKIINISTDINVNGASTNG